MRLPPDYPAVFVTDGNQRSTLAVVRALGRAGIPVTVGEVQLPSLAGSSRYCQAQLCYPSPSQNPAGFEQFLGRELNRKAFRVMIPMTDVAMQLVARMHASLDPRLAIPIPGSVTIRQTQDKAYVLELAQRLGIPCPRTVRLDAERDIEQAGRSLRFPVVIKPRFSNFCQAGRWLSTQVRYAHTPEELAFECSKPDAETPGVLLQEKLAGEGRGVFLLVWDGELKAAFCHRRLREKPPSGGVSVYRESTALDEALVNKCFVLLRELQWQGPAMVEFKNDQRDGQSKLMEINGRFWGSLQLAVDAGINFPLLLYRLACGEKVAAQFDYKLGVKSRWLLGDLDQLLIRVRQVSRSSDPSGRLAPDLRACFDFMKFYEPNLHFEVCRWEDPRPGWIELKSYTRDILRRFTGHAKTDSRASSATGRVAGAPGANARLSARDEQMPAPGAME